MKKSILTSTTLALVLLTLVSCTNNENGAPGMTVHAAVFTGNLKAVERHIKAKTDLNTKDEYGSTPLSIAATFGKTEIAKKLVLAGANLNETSADGSTSLHTAAFFGRIEMVKIILENGVNTSLKNSYGITALESVSSPFEQVKPVYDQLAKDLGPLGLKLDYEKLQEVRPLIAEMISKAESK